jgi:hypothetical protein
VGADDLGGGQSSAVRSSQPVGVENLGGGQSSAVRSVQSVSAGFRGGGQSSAVRSSQPVDAEDLGGGQSSSVRSSQPIDAENLGGGQSSAVLLNLPSSSQQNTIVPSSSKCSSMPPPTGFLSGNRPTVLSYVANHRAVSTARRFKLPGAADASLSHAVSAQISGVELPPPEGFESAPNASNSGHGQFSATVAEQTPTAGFGLGPLLPADSGHELPPTTVNNTQSPVARNELPITLGGRQSSELVLNPYSLRPNPASVTSGAPSMAPASAAPGNLLFSVHGDDRTNENICDYSSASGEEDFSNDDLVFRKVPQATGRSRGKKTASICFFPTCDEKVLRSDRCMYCLTTPAQLEVGYCTQHKDHPEHLKMVCRSGAWHDILKHSPTLKRELGLETAAVVQTTGDQLDRSRLNPATFTHFEFMDDEKRFETLCSDCNGLALKYALVSAAGKKSSK